MKGDIEGRLQSSSVRGGAAAFIGVLLFTVLMISREGMETALLLMQLRETLNLAVGAVLGVGGAAVVAVVWSRYGHRLNLALFFQLTADHPADRQIPGWPYTFGQLIDAQAIGDARTLEDHALPVLRINLGQNPDAGLAALERALASALKEA